MLTLTVDDQNERGLLGVALDPSFDSNGFVYLYYTSTSGTVHNRVSRFTVSGNVAAPASEAIIMELPTLGATNHNGGALHFGVDGKLYVGVGDNAVGANAQSDSTVLGKLLRLNADGSLPADNPFVGTRSGQARYVWADGLRNPFTFAVQATTGRIHINDVGEGSWEEINLGAAGANYGWPGSEGPTPRPASRLRSSPTNMRPIRRVPAASSTAPRSPAARSIRARVHSAPQVPRFRYHSWSNHFDFVSRGGRYTQDDPIIAWTALIGQCICRCVRGYRRG